MKTVTEKYHAVNEGAMSKAEFVRQMRLAHPRLISQFNGFDDSVQILKNRGLLFEKKEEVEYENPSYNLSPDAVRRGLRYELELAGLDPAGDISEDDYMKAHKKAEENIKKDQLYYYRMITHGETEVEHDKMKETKRGAQETDADNAMAKVKLNESTNKKKLVKEEDSLSEISLSELGKKLRELKKFGRAIEKKEEVKNPLDQIIDNHKLKLNKESIIKLRRFYKNANSEPELRDSVMKAFPSFLKEEEDEDKYSLRKWFRNVAGFYSLYSLGTWLGYLVKGIGFTITGGKLLIYGLLGAGIAVLLESFDKKYRKNNDDDTLKEEPNEGNKFEAERLKAIKGGKEHFEVDGKTFPVKGVGADDKKRAAMNEAEQKIKQALKKRIVKILKEGHEETLHMDVPQIEEPENSDSSKLSSMVEDNQYSTEERKTLLKLDNLVNTVTGDTLSYQEQLRSTLSEFPADSQILDDALEAFKSDVNARFESAFSNMDSSKEEVKSEKEVEAMQQEQERLQQEMEKESKQTVFSENKKTK